jgi:hypothetical protein
VGHGKALLSANELREGAFRVRGVFGLVVELSKASLVFLTVQFEDLLQVGEFAKFAVYFPFT